MGYYVKNFRQKQQRLSAGSNVIELRIFYQFGAYWQTVAERL